MSRWLDGFKVVRERGVGRRVRIYSALAGALTVGGIRTRYHEGRITRPGRGGGPFAVFRHLEDARIFRTVNRTTGRRNEFLVVRACAYWPSTASHLWTQSWRAWLLMGRGFPDSERHVSACPYGTRFAAQVILGERLA